MNIVRTFTSSPCLS